MKLTFSKYHGSGNDFILIDNRTGTNHLSREQINYLCDRHLGIGADGLMLLMLSDKFDFEMKYFNADGGEGTMCGNGGRCITAFAKQCGQIKNKAEFKAIDGLHKSEILESNETGFQIRVSLKDVVKIKQQPDYFVIDTGSPHYVTFYEDLEKIDIYQEGKQIRWDKKFRPEGLNVNFVKKAGNHLTVRTFERGVENITLSCGTGVTAAAIAANVLDNNKNQSYDISTFGGTLTVSFHKEVNTYKNVVLEGPVKHVFDGTIELPGL